MSSLNILEKPKTQPLPSIEVTPDSKFSYEAKNENEPSVSSTDTTSEPIDLLKEYQNRLDSVVSKRQTYDELLNKHNDSLYDILSDCYSMAIAAKHDSKNQTAIMSALEKYKSKAKKRVQRHSTFEHVLVRFVFDESCDAKTDSPTRHSVSVYAIVLHKASESNISSDKFVSWIRENGGVDKIRRKNAATTASHAKNASDEKRIFVGSLSGMKLSDGEKITLHTTYIGRCAVRLDKVVVG